MATGSALTWRRIGVLLAGTGMLAGCMTANAQNQVSLVKPPSTVIPSGTSDARAMAAVSTYAAFTRTLQYAQRHPSTGRPTPEANLGRYSIDPVQSQYEAFVATLARSGHAFHGTPPKTTIAVKAIDLDADPYPMVTLSDCQTETENWRAYSNRTKKMNPALKPGIPAPYGLLVDVVYMKQRWNVQTIKADPAGTCTG